MARWLRGITNIKNVRGGPKHIITVKIYENAPATANFAGVDCKCPAAGDITMAIKAMRRSLREVRHDIRKKQTQALKQEANDARHTE